MAAIDDSWDVHYKCIEMGLDPDRVSHLARARAQLCREADERYERRNPMTPERAAREQAARDRNTKRAAALGELFKKRYGAYSPDEE